MKSVQHTTILLDRVSLRVRDRIVFRDTTWRIEAGQHWAVIGPNGAGKTTLAEALVGRTPVVGGKIHRPSFLLQTHAVGYVSWERQRMTVLRDAGLDEARSFSGRPDDWLRVRELFPEFSAAAGIESPIAPYWNRPLRTLSTGERTLVFLVLEVLKRPRLLVLDEPFAGLDERNRRWLQDTLTKSMARHTQLILITHRIEEILPNISHVLAVREGRVCFCGHRNDVLSFDRLQQLYDRNRDRVSPLRQLPGFDRRGGVRVDMRKVTVRYGRQVVLKDIDWKIRDHQHWAVTGPNGAGKSTLMQLIAGDHPQAYVNEIYWFGRRRGSGETIWEIKQEIGMVSAEFQLRYHRPIRALDVVLSGFYDSVGLYRQASVRQRETAARWITHLGLDALAERRFDSLSSGEQRSLLLARALVKSPRLLILDEPCQGLDRSARYRFLRRLEEIGRNGSVQLLYVTHRPMELPACITHCLRLVPAAGGSFTAEKTRRAATV